LRFPGFEGEWVKAKLEDVTEKINSGKTPLGGQSTYLSEGIIFIRSQNVNNDQLELSSPIFISEEVNNGMKNSVVKPNDILLNITGASLGRSCVVPEDFKVGNVNQHVCIIRPKKDYTPRFIQPILSSAKGQAIFESLQTGSGREGLNFESIKKIELDFPTLDEQKRIADFLSLIDQRIQTQNKIIKNLKVQMLGLQEMIFRRKIKMKGENGKIFPEWELRNGGDLFFSTSNKTHNSDLPILAITQDQGAVPRDSIDYQISVTDKSVESYKVVEIGDFIISLRSFQGGIEYSNFYGICSPAYIILKSKREVENLFYKYYFKTPGYIKLLNKKLEGIRDGKMISYNYFSEITLPYPSVEEQTKIANMLLHFDQKIELEKRILKEYENEKQYLLQNLFM
jgi:type I restriction enzyme S subunit